jgi:hypothetical protein
MNGVVYYLKVEHLICFRMICALAGICFLTLIILVLKYIVFIRIESSGIWRWRFYFFCLGKHKLIGAKVNILRVLFGVVFGFFGIF